jgi:molecular chaperone GrpE (heat shock protein)
MTMTDRNTDSRLDLDHELPAAEDTQESAAPQADAELENLKAERDTLYDRLARLQAEFDNFLKR